MLVTVSIERLNNPSNISILGCYDHLSVLENWYHTASVHLIQVVYNNAGSSRRETCVKDHLYQNATSLFRLLSILLLWSSYRFMVSNLSCVNDHSWKSEKWQLHQLASCKWSISHFCQVKPVLENPHEKDHLS